MTTITKREQFSFWMRFNSAAPLDHAFRLVRGFKYICFALAAAVTAVAPSNVIFGIFSQIPAFAYIWSAIFFVGSILCLYGILAKKWTGEYGGLPGVITCLLLYATGCFVDVGELTPQRVFLGFVFLAFTASSYARWQDVRTQKRIADYEKRVRDGKAGV